MPRSKSSEIKPLSDKAREWAFRVMYAQAQAGEEMHEILSTVAAQLVIPDDEWAALGTTSPYLPDPRNGKVAAAVWKRIEGDVTAFVEGVSASTEQLEAAITGASRRWRLDRMPVVDRTLLKLGCYELIVRPAQPARRVINRTVELAKRYGQAESRRFVNGILDQIRRDHGVEAG